MQPSIHRNFHSCMYDFLNLPSCCAEHVDTLINFNTKDILLAKERFGNRRKKPVDVSSQDSSVVTEEEKKIRKAKKFGVQLIPDLGVINRTVDNGAEWEEEEESDENDKERREVPKGLKIISNIITSHDVNSPSSVPPSPAFVLSPAPGTGSTGHTGTPPHTEKTRSFGASNSPTITPRSPRVKRRSAQGLSGADWTPVPAPRSPRISVQGLPGVNWSPVPAPRVPRRKNQSETLSQLSTSENSILSPIHPRSHSTSMNFNSMEKRPIPKPRKLKSTSSTSSESSVSLTQSPSFDSDRNRSSEQFITMQPRSNAESGGGLMSASNTTSLLNDGLPSNISDAQSFDITQDKATSGLFQHVLSSASLEANNRHHQHDGNLPHLKNSSSQSSSMVCWL